MLRAVLRIARRGGRDFDNGVGKLAHSADKDFDDGPVKLRVGAALQFGKGFGRAAAFLVSAVAGDGVVSVGHRNDARTERNALAGKSVRIARAIEEFVMMENHLANVGQGRERVQDLGAKTSRAPSWFPIPRD